VIGPEKLKTIRQELERAFSADGDDPIRWLEARMNALDRQGPAAPGQIDVLRSLRHFLEGTGREKRRSRRVRTQK
jgi:hypothetical protein